MKYSTTCLLVAAALLQSREALSFATTSTSRSSFSVTRNHHYPLPVLVLAAAARHADNDIDATDATRGKQNNYSSSKILFSKTLATAALLLTTFVPLLQSPTAATAAESRVVGQLKGSGLVFKDTLQIESFDDPKVRGVTLYVSTFQKPITERMGRGFFSDPAYASVACAKTGRVAVADNIATGSGGEEVFEESRSLLFKTLRVQRLYDQAKNTVVYVSFNTRFDKGDDSNKSRFKSSLCAVNLDEPTATAAATTVNGSGAAAAGKLE